MHTRPGMTRHGRTPPLIHATPSCARVPSRRRASAAAAPPLVPYHSFLCSLRVARKHHRVITWNTCHGQRHLVAFIARRGAAAAAAARAGDGACDDAAIAVATAAAVEARVCGETREDMAQLQEDKQELGCAVNKRQKTG